MSEKAPRRIDKEQVYITVSGGVAYVAQTPENVEVRIIDFDNLKADYNGAIASLSPEERAFLRVMECENSSRHDETESLG